MKNKKERLNEVYNYLHAHYGVHTKTEFASALNLKRPGIYSAFSGNEGYLTNNLFVRICKAYPNIFNLDYLLTGEGDLLLSDKDKTEEVGKQTLPNETHTLFAGLESLINIVSQQIKENEELRRELQSSIREVKQIANNLLHIHIPKKCTDEQPEYYASAEPDDTILSNQI